VDLADLVYAGCAGKGVALMRGWLGSPPVHFVALGALVFTVESWRAGDAVVTVAPLASSRIQRAPSDDELLEREARRLGLERDDGAVQRRLVRNLRFLGEGATGDDASDFEEALALGLDRSDLVVRRRLVQRLELRALAWARASEPSDAELTGLLEREAERFVLPARTRLSQVFLSRDRHTGGLAVADRALAKRLVLLKPTSGAGLGDPFLLGSDLAPRTQAELAARFGEPFARSVAALPVGRWSGPIASSYGLHHVFVHDRTPARTPRLEAVRSAVREAVFAERAALVLADWLRQLRSEAS
jgi:hypothetical protein